MNINILTDEKRPALNRREITAKLLYEKETPSRKNIRREVAKKFGVKEEMVVVKLINPEFGTPAANLEVHIYDDEKALKELEGKYMFKRHTPKEKKAEAAPTPAPAPAEKPAEGEAPKKEEPEKEIEETPEQKKEEEKPEEKKE